MMSASILTITGGHSVDLDAFRAMIDDISAAALAPSNGRRPAVSSCNITPSEKRSER